MKKRLLIHFFNIFLVILSMVTIFLFSSENSSLSSKTSRNVVKEVVKTVIKDETKAVKIEKKITDNIHYVRKTAHLIEFFILGFLVINLLKDYKKINKKIIVLSIIICLLYACTDEFHQIFVSGRAGRISDIAIDTIGSILGVTIYYLIYNKFKKMKQNI